MIRPPTFWKRAVRDAAKVLNAVAFAASLATVAFPAPAVAQANWRPTDDDALLLDFRLGRYRLGESVDGYQTPNGPCIDLGGSIMALDLAIRIDVKSRRATGWAFEEGHRLTVDLEAGEALIDHQGQKSIHKVAPHDVYEVNGGWCVAAPTLAAWLGVSLKADQANAIVTVSADRPLPVERALARRQQAQPKAPTPTLADLPVASRHNVGLRLPGIDVTTLTGVQRDGPGHSLKSQRRYELIAVGELGPFGYEARIAAHRAGRPDTVRVRVHRTDPEARIGGPLRATEVAAGDVAFMSSPLVSGAALGRGVMITNQPLYRPDNFDRTSFVGELPVGWDAELYRDGELIGVRLDAGNGRYAFEDVPLRYGANDFEVVLYGPQGQQRRIRQSYPVGGNSIPPAKTYYWAGANQAGRDLFALNPDGEARDQGPRMALGLERGLDRRTSVAFSVQRLTLEEVGRRDFMEASLRRALGGTLAEVGLAHSHGGWAWRVQGLGAMGPITWALESRNARGQYVSDRLEAGIRGVHELMLSSRLGAGRNVMPLSLETRFVKQRSGHRALDSRFRISRHIMRLSFTGELRYRQDLQKGMIGGGTRAYDAALMVNGHLGRVRLRGEARIGRGRGEQASGLMLGAELQGRGALASSSRIEMTWDATRKHTRVQIGHTRRLGPVAIGVSGNAATDGSVAASLNLSFSFGVDGGALRMRADPIATRGATRVNIFRDLNLNGRRDPGEPPEPGVRVLGDPSPRIRESGADGALLLDGLVPWQPTLITVDASSLSDPFLQPVGRGVVLRPRPGVTLPVDLPLVPSGGIEGTLVRDGRDYGGLNLELVDEGGLIIARSSSDYDGYFVFDSVPYGRYTLRIEAGSAALAQVETILKPALSLNARSPSLSLGGVTVSPLAAPAASGSRPETRPPERVEPVP